MSRTVRGRQLQTGSRLLALMLDKVGEEVEEIHLIVRRDNIHARALYERMGMRIRPWQLYEPDAAEMYMRVSRACMTERVAEVKRRTEESF